MVVVVRGVLLGVGGLGGDILTLGVRFQIL